MDVVDYDSATDGENPVRVHAEDLSIRSHRTFRIVKDEEDNEATYDGVDIDRDDHPDETLSVHIVSTVRIVIVQLVRHALLLFISSVFAEADILVVDRPHNDVPVGHEDVEE